MASAALAVRGTEKVAQKRTQAIEIIESGKLVRGRRRSSGGRTGHALGGISMKSAPTPSQSWIRVGEPGSARCRCHCKGGFSKAPLGAPLVRRGGGSGAADGTVRAAALRRVELLPKVPVGVREEILMAAVDHFNRHPLSTPGRTTLIELLI